MPKIKQKQNTKSVLKKPFKKIITRPKPKAAVRPNVSVNTKLVLKGRNSKPVPKPLPKKSEEYLKDEDVFKKADTQGKGIPDDMLKVQASGDWEPSQCRLAARLGCSQSSIKNYILRGMPFSPTMGYNVDVCVKWINDWKATRGPMAQGRPLGGVMGPVGAIDPVDRQERKLRLMSAKLKAETLKLKQDTRGKRLKNDEYEGLLLPADEVRLWIASRFLRVKQRLEMLPDELQMLAPSALRPQLRADLANNIHALLMEMASWQSQAETKEFTGEEE